MIDPPEEPSRSRVRWPVWAAYVALMVIGVPWYWPPGDQTVVLGLPAWVAVAVAASAAASVLTAWLLRNAWPAEDESHENEERP